MSSKGSKFFVGAVVAAAAGYVAGILTAPKSGKETREDIKRTTATGVAEAKKRLDAIHKELNDIKETAVQQASHYSDKAKAEFQKALEVAEHAKDKLSDVVKNGTSSDKDLSKALDEAQSAVTHLKSYLKK